MNWWSNWQFRKAKRKRQVSTCINSHTYIKKNASTEMGFSFGQGKNEQKKTYIHFFECVSIFQNIDICYIFVQRKKSHRIFVVFFLVFRCSGKSRKTPSSWVIFGTVYNFHRDQFKDNLNDWSTNGNIHEQQKCIYINIRMMPTNEMRGTRVVSDLEEKTQIKIDSQKSTQLHKRR